MNSLRRFLRQAWSFSKICFLLVLPFIVSCNPSEYHYLVFVGTYTDKGSEGIYSFRFNPVTGDFSTTELAAATDNPSFITIDPRGKFLYTVNEIEMFNDEPSGAISAFAINRETGKLCLLEQISSLGAGPAHLSLDKSGRFLMVANYTGGSIAVFPIGTDGRPGKQTAFNHHVGSSVNSERQTGPHAHFIQVTDDNRFVMVADLGIDKILIYKFDATHGSLTLNNPGFVELASGAGPRHFAFAPSGNILYVLNELSSSATVFDYDPISARLSSKQTISTLPEHFTGTNTAAEILADTKGKFLYVSNRGDDSIVQFHIDPDNGHLSPGEWVPSGGKTPRNFEIDPTGRWLFAANQNSDNIMLFKIDQESGHLISTSRSIKVISPVCLRFLK